MSESVFNNTCFIKTIHPLSHQLRTQWEPAHIGRGQRIHSGQAARPWQWFIKTLITVLAQKQEPYCPGFANYHNPVLFLIFPTHISFFEPVKGGV